jgi:hypothetical protein
VLFCGKIKTGWPAISVQNERTFKTILSALGDPRLARRGKPSAFGLFLAVSWFRYAVLSNTACTRRGYRRDEPAFSGELFLSRFDSLFSAALVTPAVGRLIIKNEGELQCTK